MIKQKDRSKRGSAAKRKGANAELELAKILREAYGLNVRRGHTFNGESDMVGLDGIHPEVKRVEKLNIHKAMKQAIDEAKKRLDGFPTVFFRRDREDWLVCMRLTDWIELYRRWKCPESLK